MFKEFKNFLLHGNVFDVAVGIIIGAAFGKVVTALVSDLLTPLIASFTRVPDFNALAFTLNGSKFMLGAFINDLLSFVLVSAAVFFFVVKPKKILISLSKKKADPTTKICKECLSEIPFEAKRCSHCAQPTS